MPSTTAISGTDGNVVVDDRRIARITNWTLNPVSGIDEWGDSDTARFTNTRPTRRGATGTMEGKIDTDYPVYNVFEEGDAVELVLWLSTTAGHYYALPCAIITSFNLQVSPDSKEVIAWSADFAADGQYYRPGEAGAPSHSLPSAPSV